MTAPLVEMIGMQKRFGAVRAVDDVSCELHAGEVVGLLGHNGAGKTTLMKLLAGVYPEYGGTIKVRGDAVKLVSPRDAQRAGIETIYQHLALADNLDAAGNLFLGRELRTGWGTLDTHRMAHEAGKIIHRINPNFTNTHLPVRALSGGQRQTVAIARALYFDAKILIMDEPTAALGPGETRMVKQLITGLKQEGIGIFLVSHELRDVFDVCDRLVVMKNGKLVGTTRVSDVTEDEVLGMIISGKRPGARAEAPEPSTAPA
ncbi:MAG TPA: ATP-binding cassette domain-containing protein [Kofleriaceae bacterium]|jgi:D-xylose transport system ATP-binding protein|nr:ATP-binding cassette domain-containing protein [Kofleriaceae bacterium]